MSRLDAFCELLGKRDVDEIRFLGDALRDVAIQHVNSTATGGGVAEILARLVPMMNEIGLQAVWTVMEAGEEFFEVSKRLHNALHGAPLPLTSNMKDLFLAGAGQNRDKIREDADYVILHDPQPLPLIPARSSHEGIWIWRCHIDLTEAKREVWRFLKPLVEMADGAIFHMPEYTKDLSIPQYIIPPAIDPFSDKNREMTDDEIQEQLASLGITNLKPIILQVSRFDRLKDPIGVIRAYEIVKRSFDCQLILAGGSASDDPEGEKCYQEIRQKAEGIRDLQVLRLPADSNSEINALQRAATVVLQKSLREGFGLTVTEAMWKGKPVVGGNVGGIRRQIIEGITGFLVESSEGAAFRIRQLLADQELRHRMGETGREFVKQNFLMAHYLKNWLLVLLGLRNREKAIIHWDTPNRGLR
jgi:trehalose synthase